MQTISERLQQAMDARAMTVRELAATTGEPDQNIRLWLRGRRISNPESLSRLAIALDTTTDWLITGQDPTTAMAERSAS